MAIQISNCSASFGSHLSLNTVYEPVSWDFNGKKAWVARGDAKLYLFHTKKARWVIGRQMDDGSRCYAFLTDDGNSQSPCDCEQAGGVWQTGGTDQQWTQDAGMKSTMVPASKDLFSMLRVKLEDEMRGYGLVEPGDLKALWKKMDKDGNNEIDISEMQSLASEMSKAGIWPKWMDCQEPLELAFQTTLEESEDGDGILQQEEFHDLLLNMFFYCKIFEIYQEIDVSRDGVVTLEEFKDGMRMLHIDMSDQQLTKEFNSPDLDKDGNGADFKEFCYWVRQRVSPEHNHSFDTDKSSASKIAKKQSAEATSGVVTRKKNFADFDALEKKIKNLCNDESGKGIQKLWKRLDFNGNNVVSLAEIDKWIVECWPLLNHKPASMRAFKATTEAGGDRDGYVHKKDFKRLIINLFYFNKLFWLFDQVDEDHDRRMNLKEFTWCLAMCGCKMSGRKAEAEFAKVDTNRGGIILFDEFCKYFAQKQCPTEMADFVADE